MRYTDKILQELQCWIRDCNTHDHLSLNGGYADTTTGEFVGWAFEKPRGQVGRMGFKVSAVMAFDVVKNWQVIDKARP